MELSEGCRALLPTPLEEVRSKDTLLVEVGVISIGYYLHQRLVEGSRGRLCREDLAKSTEKGWVVSANEVKSVLVNHTLSVRQ